MKRIIHHAKQHYHKRYREPYAHRAPWYFLFDQFLIGMVVTLLCIGAYYAFIFNPLRDDFRFTAEIPALAAGQEAEVKLTVSNVGKRRFHNVVFSAYLPDRFLITRFPEGYDPKTKSTPVGTMEPETQVDFTMHGFVVGPPSEVPVYVRMTASDDKGNVDERIFTVNVAWTENRIKGAFIHPPAILGSQTFPLTFTFKNGSPLRLDDVRVRPAFPAGYRLRTSTPPLSNGEARIGPIASGETVEVRFFGQTPPSLEAFNVSADVVWVVGDTEILLDKVTLEHAAVTTGLSFKAAFDATEPVKPGDEVPFTVEYANDGAYALKNVTFSVPVDTRLVDAPQGRVTVGTIATLRAGDRGTLSGTLKLKPAFSEFVTDPSVAVSPEAKLSLPEADLVGAMMIGEASARRKVAGTASLESVARYFTSEGEQLGRGILPPKVGKETRYWIFVSVETGSSNLTDTLIETHLPANVRWTGKGAVFAGDELVERESGSVVVWRIGDLPAHAGKLDTPATASFEVELVPDASQVGQPAFLTLKTDLTARDAWTETDVVQSQPGVTTELSTDTRIRGRIFVSP